jgi:hypothetical protein
MDDYTSADAVLILVSNVRLIGSPKQRRPGMEKGRRASASPRGDRRASAHEIQYRRPIRLAGDGVTAA